MCLRGFERQRVWTHFCPWEKAMKKLTGPSMPYFKYTVTFKGMKVIKFKKNSEKVRLYWTGSQWSWWCNESATDLTGEDCALLMAANGPSLVVADQCGRCPEDTAGGSPGKCRCFGAYAASKLSDPAWKPQGATAAVLTQRLRDRALFLWEVRHRIILRKN